MEEFPERAMYKDFGITAGRKTGSAGWQSDVENMTTVGGGGILDNYQWV